MYINHILSVCADSADILNHLLKIERVHFAHIYLYAHTSSYEIFFTFYQTVKKKNLNHVLHIVLQMLVC